MLGAIIYVVVAGRSFIRSVLLNNDDIICMNNKGLKNLTRCGTDTSGTACIINAYHLTKGRKSITRNYDDSN
jgi:hypothetical protein